MVSKGVVMQLVGISGYARSGKDSVGRVLVNELGYVQVAWADALREMALALDPIVGYGGRGARLRDVITHIGWDRAKEVYPEVRVFMQRLGTDGARKVFGPDIWVKTLMARVNPYERTVITDCRFVNEAQAVKDRGGEMWRVVRPGVDPINAHISETALDDFEFDRVIDNVGTLEDLRTKVLQSSPLPA